MKYGFINKLGLANSNKSKKKTQKKLFAAKWKNYKIINFKIVKNFEFKT